jgi:hypothetical protein
MNRFTPLKFVHHALCTECQSWIKVGPGRYYSPRHRMPYKSGNNSCMTWWASAGPLMQETARICPYCTSSTGRDGVSTPHPGCPPAPGPADATNQAGVDT